MSRRLTVDGPSSSVLVVEEPELDTIANDPVLSPTIPTSQSRSRIPVILVSGDNGSTNLSAMDERDPLLGGGGGMKEPKKPFYRPRPMW